MNPWHCSGRFSNPDPLRTGGSGSDGETLCCQPDRVLSFEGGRPPSWHILSPGGSAAGAFCSPGYGHSFEARVTVLWALLTNLNHVKADCWPLLKRQLGSFKTVLHNWNGESCGKDKAGSAIKFKHVRRPWGSLICPLNILTKVMAGGTSGQTLLGSWPRSPFAHIGVSEAVSTRWLNACGLGPVAHQPWKDVPLHRHVCGETHA